MEIELQREKRKSACVRGWVARKREGEREREGREKREERRKARWWKGRDREGKGKG